MVFLFCDFEFYRDIFILDPYVSVDIIYDLWHFVLALSVSKYVSKYSNRHLISIEKYIYIKAYN